MNMLLLAQTPQSFSQADNASMWLVVIAIITLANGAASVFTLVKFASGKSGERQIEPTQIAAIRGELKTQTDMLTNLNREIGESRINTDLTAGDLRALQEKQSKDIGGAHRRIDALSEKVAGIDATVVAIQRQCPKC